MGKTDTRQSLAEEEETFLRKFSLRKFTVPIEKLSNQSIGLNQPKNDVSIPDPSPEKDYHIEYKKLERPLQLDVPWWLKARSICDNSDAESDLLATLVKGPAGRVRPPLRLHCLYQAMKPRSTSTAFSISTRTVTPTIFCNSRDASKLGSSLTTKEKINHEEHNDIFCVKRRLRRVLKILHSLKSLRLNSGCEKCQRKLMANNSLSCLKKAYVEKSGEAISHMSSSSALSQRDLCICDLQVIEKEIDDLSQYIVKTTSNKRPSNDPNLYESLQKRVKKLRKSLAEASSKALAGGSNSLQSSSEQLQNVQYFVKPRKLQISKEQYKTISKPKRNQVVDMRSDQSSFCCCKEIESGISMQCNLSTEQIISDRISTKTLTCSQPLEIIGQRVNIYEPKPCKLVQTDFSLPTVFKTSSQEKRILESLDPDFLRSGGTVKFDNFVISCQQLQSGSNEDPKFIPCLIIKQINEDPGSSLRNPSKESVDADLSCKYEEDEDTGEVDMWNDSDSQYEINLRNTFGSKHSEHKNRAYAGIEENIVSIDVKKNDSEKQKEIPELQLETKQQNEKDNENANKSEIKAVKVDSLDKLVFKGKGPLKCLFEVLPDVNLCYTAEPENFRENGQRQTYFKSTSEKVSATKRKSEISAKFASSGKVKPGKTSKQIPIQFLHRIHIEKIMPPNDNREIYKTKFTTRRWKSCSSLPFVNSTQKEVSFGLEDENDQNEVISHAVTSKDSLKSQIRRSRSCIVPMPSMNENNQIKSKSRETIKSFTQTEANMSSKNSSSASINRNGIPNFCKQCIGKDIPIITENLAREIRKIAGIRERNSVFLKFTMVGGNLFHLQMCTDDDYLGCLYATQWATLTARKSNGFDGFITLCVTDSSNSASEIQDLVDHAFMIVQKESNNSIRKKSILGK